MEDEDVDEDVEKVEAQAEEAEEAGDDTISSQRPIQQSMDSDSGTTHSRGPRN